MLAARKLGPEAEASFLDGTFLADRRTTLRCAAGCAISSSMTCWSLAQSAKHRHLDHNGLGLQAASGEEPRHHAGAAAEGAGSTLQRVAALRENDDRIIIVNIC